MSLEYTHTQNKHERHMVPNASNATIANDYLTVALTDSF